MDGCEILHHLGWLNTYKSWDVYHRFQLVISQPSTVWPPPLQGFPLGALARPLHLPVLALGATGHAMLVPGGASSTLEEQRVVGRWWGDVEGWPREYPTFPFFCWLVNGGDEQRDMTDILSNDME